MKLNDVLVDRTMKVWRETWQSFAHSLQYMVFCLYCWCVLSKSTVTVIKDI